MQTNALQKTTDKADRKTKIVKWAKWNIPSYLFLSPFFIGFFIFTLYPIISSFCYSFMEYNGVVTFGIGSFNWKELFSVSTGGLLKDVARSFGITFGYALLSIPLNMLLSFALALVLRKSLRGMRVLRLLCYLPVLIPSIVFGQIWRDMLAYPSGLIGQWMTSIGLPQNTFFDGERTQFMTLLITSQWGIGGGLIMWLAALGNIPSTLYESAKLDGASYFRILFRLTIPMCTPIIFYNLVSAVIACLQTFDTYSYVGRGINDGLYFISVRVYVTAFTEKSFGMACAIAWLLFAVIALLTALMFKYSKWVFHGEDS
jgi:ABC-type sugar transport system permease subunit